MGRSHKPQKPGGWHCWNAFGIGYPSFNPTGNRCGPANLRVDSMEASF
jgi:hypothetical protein